MKSNKISYLFGKENIQVYPQIPYNSMICEFLDEVSKVLRADSEAKGYADIMTFAFWIRKANILKLKEQYHSNYMRLGKGIVFHIAPSNVPINFAYSLVFGLLSGNSNIVKASSKRFVQTEIICNAMQTVAERTEFFLIQECNQVVIYEREEEEFTKEFSANCDVRIIWGGDQTIQAIRKFQLAPRSIEITFADRYSFGIINADVLLKSTEKEISQLVNGFYNDTYLMDQNACSSPHFIFWKGTKEKIEKAKQLFWRKVYERALLYPLEYIKSSDKYVMLCEMAAQGVIKKAERFENLLYVAELLKLPKDISSFRGKFGLFYEYILSGLEELTGKIGKKMQTCAVFGIDSQELGNWIQKEHVVGIDRVVPFGKTLDITTVWDGYDVIGMLSRCIDLQ